MTSKNECLRTISKLSYFTKHVKLILYLIYSIGWWKNNKFHIKLFIGDCDLVKFDWINEHEPTQARDMNKSPSSSYDMFKSSIYRKVNKASISDIGIPELTVSNKLMDQGLKMKYNF